MYQKLKKIIQNNQMVHILIITMLISIFITKTYNRIGYLLICTGLIIYELFKNLKNKK